MNIDNDLILIESMKNGDVEAFTTLYDKYWEKLYFTCYKKINSRIDTEDIVQELFIDIWNNRQNLDLRSAFAVYIFTALKYKIFRFIDTRNTRKKYVDKLEGFEPASSDNIEEIVSFEELYNMIEQSIEKLPDKCKLIFKMSRNEEMSAEEISAKLDLSLSTVHNQITKAKKILKNTLNQVFFFV